MALVVWPLTARPSRGGVPFLSLAETPSTIGPSLREEGECTHVMIGRSRMTIDLRISTMPGVEHIGFHRRDIHCRHQARITVICWAKRTKGALRPTKKGGRRLREKQVGGAGVDACVETFAGTRTPHAQHRTNVDGVSSRCNGEKTRVYPCGLA